MNQYGPFSLKRLRNHPKPPTPSHIQLSGGAGTWTQVFDWEPFRSSRVSPASSSRCPASVAPYTPAVTLTQRLLGEPCPAPAQVR